jgi:hypothetical protein
MDGLCQPRPWQMRMVQTCMQAAEKKAAEEREEQLTRERQQAEAAAQAAEQERQELNRQRQMLVARAEGSAVIAKAGPGLTTSGRVEVPATIEVSAVVSNVVAGEAGPVISGAANVTDAEVRSLEAVLVCWIRGELMFTFLHHHYIPLHIVTYMVGYITNHYICGGCHEPLDMQDIIIAVAGEVARLFCQQQRDAYSAQEAIGRGPLTKMDSTELQHWMNAICMAVQAAVTSRLRTACATFSAGDDTQPHAQHFSVCSLITIINVPCWLCCEVMNGFACIHAFSACMAIQGPCSPT